MSEEHASGEETAEFTPERWELAIEDAAELVALMLERGQGVYDDLRELWKARPLLVSSVAAVAAGAVVGAIVAGMRTRRRVAARAVVSQASAVAQAAAQRLTEQPAGLRSIRRGVRLNGVAAVDRKKRIIETGRSAQEAMRLVPVVVAILKNPFVRRLLWRYARSALRR